MAENLIIAEGGKEEKYKTLFPQIKSVIDTEEDMIARMANVSSMLHQTFGFLWTGFYRVASERNELVLGPFQGPVACSRIGYGKGVCGTAWAEGRTVIVPDVDRFPGHIACSSSSRSEIVVPVLQENRVIAVLDIDSAFTDTFNDMDRSWLEIITALIK